MPIYEITVEKLDGTHERIWIKYAAHGFHDAITEALKFARGSNARVVSIICDPALTPTLTQE
jgi:hypothetical protein